MRSQDTSRDRYVAHKRWGEAKRHAESTIQLLAACDALNVPARHPDRVRAQAHYDRAAAQESIAYQTYRAAAYQDDIRTITL